MNLINNVEVQVIDKLAMEVKEKYEFTKIDKEKETYYIDVEQQKLYPEILYEYDVEVPMDLKKFLEDMWAYQENEEMKLFAVPMTVAAFKNRNCMKKEVDREISPYIYEF